MSSTQDQKAFLEPDFRLLARAHASFLVCGLYCVHFISAAGHVLVAAAGRAIIKSAHVYLSHHQKQQEGDRGVRDASKPLE